MGQGELIKFFKKRKEKSSSRRGPARGRRGRLRFGGLGREGGVVGERPPAPLPPVPSGDGSCTHRSPLSPAPGVQPRGLGPAAKRVSGPVSRAGLRDARAARAINNQPPGGSGCFPVTPGRGAGGGGRKETMKPPAALLLGRPGSFSPRSPVPAPARPPRSRARVWERPRRA